MDYFFIKSTSYILAQEEHFGKRDFHLFIPIPYRNSTGRFAAFAPQRKSTPKGAFSRMYRPCSIERSKSVSYFLAGLTYFSNHSQISVRRVILFSGLPLLDSSWFSPWNRTTLESTPLSFRAENICSASDIQQR